MFQYDLPTPIATGFPVKYKNINGDIVYQTIRELTSVCTYKKQDESKRHLAIYNKETLEYYMNNKSYVESLSKIYDYDIEKMLEHQFEEYL